MIAKKKKKGKKSKRLEESQRLRTASDAGGAQRCLNQISVAHIYAFSSL